MASLLTIAQLLQSMPGFVVDTTTKPSTEQVQFIIDTVEADLMAMIDGLDAVWPTDGSSVAANYLRQTIIEGAKEQVLRAKYLFTGDDKTPAELERAADAYKARTGAALKIIAAAIRRQPGADLGSSVPVVSAVTFMPTLSGSLDQYTSARDAEDSRRNALLPPYR